MTPDDSRASPEALPELAVHHIERIDSAVDRDEVIRYLGYPAHVVPPAWVHEMLDEWVPRALLHADPHASYAVFPVDAMDRRRLVLRTASSTVEFHGAIGEFLGVAQRIAAYVATAGAGIEQLARRLGRQDDPLGALVVNAVGAERAEAAQFAVIARLRAAAPDTGLVPTLPYSPGYCGMALTEQRTLFGLFAGHAIGVSLTAECVMRPLKSVSGLIGLASPDAVRQFGSPCDRCDAHRCHMRRSSPEQGSRAETPPPRGHA
jgi:hypothetical protein